MRETTLAVYLINCTILLATLLLTKALGHLRTKKNPASLSPSPSNSPSSSVTSAMVIWDWSARSATRWPMASRPESLRLRTA